MTWRVESDGTRNGWHYAIDSRADLNGWTVLHESQHKPGVLCIHARIGVGRDAEFRIGYLKTEEAPQAVASASPPIA